MATATVCVTGPLDVPVVFVELLAEVKAALDVTDEAAEDAAEESDCAEMAPTRATQTVRVSMTGDCQGREYQINSMSRKERREVNGETAWELFTTCKVTTTV